MLEPSASRFWQAALQSGLADPQALQACWDAIPHEKRVPEHIDRRLARLAVQNGVVTLWQAQQLISGRSTGFKIDRYVLLELIGQGGMGRVYLARDSRLNRRVAVKILSPERINNPRAHARFEREALVGAQLQHENLVRIYDVGDSGGRCYLVMEYIEGKNIGQMIGEHGPIPPATAAKLVRQVALGLDHGHQKGLIHRDVNPYNILVTLDGIAKLTDLGLALDLADDSDRVTRDGATVGTFDYVSPEQARHSHAVTARSDIYSLGCTLYHMVTGQVPFPTGSLPQKLYGHQEVEPEAIRDIAPEVPEGLVAVVWKMMRKPPEDRYQTCQEVAQALEPFVDEPVNLNGGGTGDYTGARDRRVTSEGAVTVETSVPPVTSDFVAGRPASSPGTPTTNESEAIAPAPAPAVEVPAPPPAPEVPTNGETEGVHLGLDFGPELSLSESMSSARPKPKAKPTPPPPTPAPIPTPAAPGAKAAPPPNVAPETPAIGVVGEAPPGESPLGVDLGLDFGPEAPLSKSSGAAKPRAKAKPTPPPAVSPKPAPAPAPAPPPAVAPEMPAIGIVGEASTEDSPLGLGLALNFGPEAPLSKSSGAAKKAKPTPAPSPTIATEPTSAPASKAAAKTPGALAKKPWFLPAVAAGAVLLLGLGFFAYRGVFGGGTGSAVVDSKGKSRVKKSANAKERPAKGQASLSPASSSSKKSGPMPQGQEVAVVEADGTRVIEPNLGDAMRVAIGRRGYVLLLNDGPLTIPAAQSLSLSGGPLRIKAGEGVRPVIRVEIKGRKPFLSTRTGTPIQIEGVTFEAKYLDPGPDTTPVIAAGSDVRLDRCAFKSESPVGGSRALEVKGENLSADGCWFENFDRAIEMDLFNGSKATLRHCMFVHTKPDAPSGASPMGWAVRLRGMPGGPGTSGRHLKMEHCTVKGFGLADFAGFSPEAPVSADLSSCVALAETLIDWEPDLPRGVNPPPAPTPPAKEALAWKGVGNQYDIRGKSWVMLSPGPGKPPVPMPDAPATLEAWAQRMGKESDTASPPVRFATESSSLSKEPTPADFALSDARANSPGAAPAFVGPGARPLAVAGPRR